MLCRNGLLDDNDDEDDEDDDEAFSSLSLLETSSLSTDAQRVRCRSHPVAVAFFAGNFWAS